MTLALPFDNSYARLPDRFHARQAPVPVAAPGLIAVNHALARDLGLDPAALETPEGIAALAGNSVPEGAEPLAQAYAGHQFGGWVPQLGDGRAILLGEVVTAEGRRADIQLKGAGRTPFSRRGDGRAAIAGDPRRRSVPGRDGVLAFRTMAPAGRSPATAWREIARRRRPRRGNAGEPRASAFLLREDGSADILLGQRHRPPDPGNRLAPDAVTEGRRADRALDEPLPGLTA